MGQFSMEISGHAGSVLSGNQQLAELGMINKDGSSEDSSNPCQGKERGPIENIREYPRFEPACQKECRAQKALFIERIIKQRIHYIAPYIFDSVYRNTSADPLKTPGA